MKIVNRYLDSPIDYSTEFTERVAGLGVALSARLRVEVRHKNDMNYNPGQQLIVYLTSEGSPVQEERAAHSFLEICISAKGPLWAILVLSAHPTSNFWYPSTLAAISNDNGVAGATFEAISEVMASAGLNRIGEEVLSELVPGRVTELDGAPATVRDLLFCELC